MCFSNRSLQFVVFFIGYLLFSVKYCFLLAFICFLLLECSWKLPGQILDMTRKFARQFPNITRTFPETIPNVFRTFPEYFPNSSCGDVSLPSTVRASSVHKIAGQTIITALRVLPYYSLVVRIYKDLL